MWVHGGASGLDKRQCTVQLTLFADGEPRVKPLLIFRGKGKRIALSELVRRATGFPRLQKTDGIHGIGILKRN